MAFNTLGAGVWIHRISKSCIEHYFHATL